MTDTCADNKKRIIVGITGASGTPLAVALLRALKESGEVEVHLVLSDGGRLTLEHETRLPVSELKALADVVHDNQSIGAAIASGSFKTDGMVVVPCSMKTLAAIHCGYADNLLQRAADVTIKEHRRLVLVPRESPLSPIHLKNMYELSMMGAVILPPVISFYHHPKTVEDMTQHLVGKIMDTLGFEYAPFIRWEGIDGQ